MQNTEQNLHALTWQQSQFWPHSLYCMPGLEIWGLGNSASDKGFCILSSYCLLVPDDEKKPHFLQAVEVWTIAHTQLQSGERGAVVAHLKRSCEEGFLHQETKKFSQCGWLARCNVKTSDCQPRSVDFLHSLWGLLTDYEILLFFSFLTGNLKATQCPLKLTLILQVELHLSWHSEVMLYWRYFFAIKTLFFSGLGNINLSIRSQWGDLNCLSSLSAFRYSCEKLMRKRSNECHCSVRKKTNQPKLV